MVKSSITIMSLITVQNIINGINLAIFPRTFIYILTSRHGGNRIIYAPLTFLTYASSFTLHHGIKPIGPTQTSSIVELLAGTGDRIKAEPNKRS